jgi:tRNA A-37 threonylcarbamoyl transferase component Bud32
MVTPEEAAKLREKDGADVDPLAGQVVGGCKLQTRLGAGGMGFVYKALHLALNKSVAIKFLSEHISNEAAKKRFLKEARAAAKLEHGNIVAVYDTGVDKGRHYIVMQFIEGESVGDLMKREGALPIIDALELVLHAARGIAAAHRIQMIHRDIKPDNIMVDHDGEVKVADFGLAKDLTDESGITMSQQAMGTPHYMSPEQAEDAKSADVRSDVYSFGATLYAMIAGAPPYNGSTPWAIISQHQTEPLPDIRERAPDVPERLWLTIEKMMAKSAEDRFQNMEEVIEQLAARKREIESDPELLSAASLSRIGPSRAHDLRTPATYIPGKGGRGSKTPVIAGVAAVGIILIVVAVLFASGVFSGKEGGVDGGTDAGGKAGGAEPATKGEVTGAPGTKKVVPVKSEEDPLSREAAKALDALLETVEGLVNRARFTQALEKLQAFPEKYMPTPSWKRLSGEKKAVVEKAVVHLRGILKKVAGNPGDPEPLLEEVGSVEKTWTALDGLWVGALKARNWGVMVRETAEQKDRLEELRTELRWIDGIARAVSGLKSEVLKDAEARLVRDEKGVVPGAEVNAGRALVIVRNEITRRKGNGEGSGERAGPGRQV